jgi:uncharacterized protein (TIGR02246 family)
VRLERIRVARCRRRSPLRRVIGVAVAGALLVLAGCASTVSQTNAQAEILRVDAEWLAAAQSRDVDRVVSFWADDAVVFPPGGPAVSGRAAIREYVVKSFQTPGFGISWKTTAVSVSSGGDIAYSTGTNRVTFNTPDGKPMAVDGKALVIWRRQAAGGWKCVIDIWNDVAADH